MTIHETDVILAYPVFEISEVTGRSWGTWWL